MNGTIPELSTRRSDRKIVPREEWLTARKKLLAAEKELTRRSDEVARERQELPWVRVDKDYRFETEGGSASLADLFRGRSQLLVYPFMFGPDYTAAVRSARPSRTASTASPFTWQITKSFSRRCRARRLPCWHAYKRRMGWTFPWASSFGSDFNFDSDASLTEEQQRKEGVAYNYQQEPPLAEIPLRTTADGPSTFAAKTGTDVATYTRERPGMSAFVLEDGVV